MILSLAKHKLDPTLKPLGFERKGLAWNRKRGEFVDVITLQKPKKGSEQVEKVTVNIALAVPEFYDAIHGKIKTRYSEAHSLIRLRPHELEDSGDKWWEVTEANRAEAAAEIQAFVLDEGIPFLESFQDFDVIASYLDGLSGWQSEYPYIQISRALVHWKLGNASRCEELLAGMPAASWPEETVRARAWMQNQAAR